MKLFLATDALDDVRWSAERALIDGVVLPDAALRHAESSDAALNWLSEFARAASMPVFVPFDAMAMDDVVLSAEQLGRVAEHVVVQVPFSEAYVPLLQRLALSGVRTAATFIGSTAQAMLAARVGAAYVFVDVDRLDAAGASGARVIDESRRLFDVLGSETHLVAVFPASGAPVVACALAGADAAVVGSATLRAMLAYPFTDQSLPEGARQPTHGERLRVTPS